MGMMVGGILRAELLSNVSQTVVDQVADELVRRTIEGKPTIIARGDETHAAQARELVAGN
jgi:hypothetical protein